MLHKGYVVVKNNTTLIVVMEHIEPLQVTEDHFVYIYHLSREKLSSSLQQQLMALMQCVYKEIIFAKT